MSDLKGMVVFIVDDEDMVLSSIKNILELETDYDIRTFTAPRRALEEMKNMDVDLVISDYMMPDLDGLEFLSAAKKIHPDTIRILLTGYADKENAIKAINTVGLYQYIEKPWNNDDLLLIIRNGLEKRKLIKSLKEKIGELEIAITDLRDIRSKIFQAFM
ncbi:MAG: response regulator [Acidobacteria bacterium]|nr:response regulator [Acidobacteriota bacterium]